MKGRDETRSQKLTKNKVGGINRDVFVFTFFLFLSFGFWYINSLSKEMEAEIRYPVRYINVPRDRIIADDSSDKLDFSLKGPGYTVLKLRLSGKKSPVLIDLSKVRYKRVPESKDPEYFIVTSGLLKSLTLQIRSGCEIFAIKPDTLFFTLNKAVSRSVTGSQEKRLTGE